MLCMRFLTALTLSQIAISPVIAQTTVIKGETVVTGKPVRLLVVPNLKSDCSIGPMPEIKLINPPKNGAIITKSDKQKTPSSYRCPNKNVDVKAIYYRSKDKFTGDENIIIEFKNSDGQVQTQNINITVEAASSKKDNDAKKDSSDL